MLVRKVVRLSKAQKRTEVAMWDYTDKVKEYFFNPKNVGVLVDADAIGEVGAIACGDALKLMLKIDPLTQVITDARFQTFGCGSAIASSSAVTEMIIGKTVDEALTITNADIADFLGGLPPEKMHCSVMGYEALQAAIAKYRGEEWQDDHEEGGLLCKCFGVDEGVIERAVRVNKLTTPEHVTFYTKAGGGCLTCFEQIEGLLARVNADMVEEGAIAATQAYRVGSIDPRTLKSKPRMNGTAIGAAKPAAKPHNGGPAAPKQSPLTPTTAAGSGGKLTMLQRIKLIESAVEELRPYLRQDGGDCELVDVDGDCVSVKLSGACIGCQMAAVTIAGVQERLVQKLGMPLRVMPVQ
jgi:NifU-like protein